MLDLDMRYWMSIIWDRYIKNYLRYFIYSDISDADIIDNLNVIFAEFMIYDKNKFIVSCNAPENYIGNYDRLDRIFWRISSENISPNDKQLEFNFKKYEKEKQLVK
jgi:hypothetical protein